MGLVSSGEGGGRLSDICGAWTLPQAQVWLCPIVPEYQNYYYYYYYYYYYHFMASGLCLGPSGLAGTRKENQSGFTAARDSEWQWHQLGHMQICILTQTHNHANIPPVSFLQAGCPSCCPTNSVKALKVLSIRVRKVAIGARQHMYWISLTFMAMKHWLVCSSHYSVCLSYALHYNDNAIQFQCNCNTAVHRLTEMVVRRALPWDTVKGHQSEKNFASHVFKYAVFDIKQAYRHSFTGLFPGQSG